MIYYSYIDRFERRTSKEKKIKDIVSCSGNPIGDTYEYKMNDGVKMLVKSGSVNRQDLIESYAESQDINNIIMRYLNGDQTAMNPNTGTYGDFRNMPTTYAEMFARAQECQNVFDKMPAEIKDAFGNSSERFWQEFGSDHFNEIFDKFNKIEKVEHENIVIEKEIIDNAE